MSRKVVCPFCYKVQEVEPGTEIIKCENCEKEFSFDQGTRFFELLITRHMNDGYRALEESTDYAQAVKSYSSILQLDRDQEDAVYYLMEAYIKLSKVREDHLRDALDVFLAYDDVLILNGENDLKVNDYLSEIVYLLIDYEAGLKRNLSSKNIFYSKEAEHIYKNRINLINEILEHIYIKFFKDNVFGEDATLSNEDFNKIMKDFKNIQNEPTSCAENAIKGLDEDEGLPLISDLIFVDKRKYFKIKRKLNAVSALGTIGLIVGLILTFSLKDNIIPGIIILSISGGIILISQLIKLIVNKINK